MHRTIHYGCVIVPFLRMEPPSHSPIKVTSTQYPLQAAGPVRLQPTLPTTPNLSGVLSEHGSIEQFYHNVDTVAAGQEFRARVDVLDVEETLAVVRVLEERWGGRIDFTDYLLMMKMDGRWRCVAKAYNQNSDTIKK